MTTRTLLKMVGRIGTGSLLLAVGAATAAQAKEAQGWRTEQTYYASVYAGSFQTAETAAVLDRSTFKGTAGFSWGRRLHRLLTLELDATASSTDYELPTGILRDRSGRTEVSLTTSGVLVNCKFGFQLGRLRPHVGVGVGAGLVDVSFTELEYLFEEPIESRFSTLTQFLAGADFRIGRRSTLGLEYRELAAQKPLLFAGEEIDGGGESVTLAYRLGW
jgi:opacity protein-like surface antigen